LGKIRRLASDTAYYGLSSIVGRAVNFLLVPFLTSPGILTVGEYGDVALVYAKIAFLIIIYTFGLETAYFRFASKAEIDEKKIFNNALSVIIIISSTVSTLLFLFDTQIITWIGLPGKEIYIRLSALIVIMDGVVAIPFAKLRYERRPRRFAFLKIINILANVFFNVFFLFFCKKIYQGEFLGSLKHLVGYVYNPNLNAEYVLISNLLANILFFFLLWNILKSYRPRVDRELLRKMLIYSYPLVLTGLAGTTNEMFSRLMLIKWLPEGFYPGLDNNEALGVFSGVYKFAIFINLAIQSYRYAAEPFFFSESSQKGSKETFARVFYYFVIVGSLAVLAISLNLEFLKYFLRSEVYWQGLHVVPFLLLAYLFLGCYINFSIWFKLTDKTYVGTYIAVIGAVITLILNYILIPVAGYEGSAIVTLLVYFYMMVAAYFLGQRSYPIPYNIKSAIIYFTLAVSLLIAGWFTDFGNFAYNQLFKEVMILIFVLIAYMLERKSIRQILK